MECKFCKAEMDENEKICPLCGMSQEEETDEQLTAETEEEIVETARQFIRKLGGFERFAEWGLV